MDRGFLWERPVTLAGIYSKQQIATVSLYTKAVVVFFPSQSQASPPTSMSVLVLLGLLRAELTRTVGLDQTKNDPRLTLRTTVSPSSAGGS